MEYCKKYWKNINVFACSMGAYFSMLAYKDEEINQCIFLSPVIDMKIIIKNMMDNFGITENRLKEEQTIHTNWGQTLYWDYYCYVNEHPIDKWNKKTSILFGSDDDLCDNETRERFIEKFKCDEVIMKGGEHYFHTEKQLSFIKIGLTKKLI